MSAEFNQETGKLEYIKTCVHCKKQYRSESKSTRYCSSECCNKHYKKVKHQREVTAKAGDITKITARCYSLAHAVADQFLEKPVDFKEADYRLHHLDGNIFNNSPFNLAWVKHEEHEVIHSKLPRINAVEVSKILLHKPELISEYQKDYFQTLESNEGRSPLTEGLVDNKFLTVVSSYRVQNFSTLEIDSLFDDLETLKVKFMTMGPKTFGKKVFHVNGKTALRQAFKERDYVDLFDAWLTEAKLNQSLSDNEVFGR